MFNSKIFNISTSHKSQVYHHIYPRRKFSLRHTFRYGNKMYCISTSNGSPKSRVSCNPQLDTPEVTDGPSMSITKQYYAQFVFIVIIIISSIIGVVAVIMVLVVMVVVVMVVTVVMAVHM